MGCHIHIVGKNNRDIPSPSIRLNAKHYGLKIIDKAEALNFTGAIFNECLDELKRYAGTNYKNDWEIILANDLTHMAEIVKSKYFKRLECG